MMRNNEFIDKYNQINTNPNIIIVKEPSSFEENLAKQDINYDYLYELEQKIMNSKEIQLENEVINHINKNLSNIYSNILNSDEQYINKNDMDQLLFEKEQEVNGLHKLITYN